VIETARRRFVAVAEEVRVDIHEGNFAHDRVSPWESEAWKSQWAMKAGLDEVKPFADPIQGG
jgi:hypothetical protein